MCCNTSTSHKQGFKGYVLYTNVRFLHCGISPPPTGTLCYVIYTSIHYYIPLFSRLFIQQRFFFFFIFDADFRISYIICNAIFLVEIEHWYLTCCNDLCLRTPHGHVAVATVPGVTLYLGYVAAAGGICRLDCDPAAIALREGAECRSCHDSLLRERKR